MTIGLRVAHRRLFAAAVYYQNVLDDLEEMYTGNTDECEKSLAKAEEQLELCALSYAAEVARTKK
jgi:hypothetical protein